MAHKGSLGLEEGLRDVATIANCLACDDFFMIVVDAIPPPSAFRGRAGTAQQEDMISDIQDNCCGPTSKDAFHGNIRFLPCPTWCVLPCLSSHLGPLR